MLHSLKLRFELFFDIRNRASIATRLLEESLEMFVLNIQCDVICNDRYTLSNGS